MQSYTCPSCGAELVCDASTAATSCPYCGNPSIVPGRLSGAQKPDYIIPFRLSKADAVAAQQRQTAAVVAAATEKVGGGGSTYQFHIEKMEVRDDQDVERVAQELYYMTEREKRSRGGGSL